MIPPLTHLMIRGLLEIIQIIRVDPSACCRERDYSSYLQYLHSKSNKFYYGYILIGRGTNIVLYKPRFHTAMITRPGYSINELFVE